MYIYICIYIICTCICLQLHNPPCFAPLIVHHVASTPTAMFHGCPAARRTSKNMDQMKTRTKPLNPLGNPPAVLKRQCLEKHFQNGHLQDVIHVLYCDLKTAHCVGIFMHILLESACSYSLPLTPPRIKTCQMLASFTFHISLAVPGNDPSQRA